MASQETFTQQSETIVLRDGSRTTMRRATAKDGPLLEEFLGALSEETVTFRFLESRVERSFLLRQIMPGPDNYVLIAIRKGVVVGHAAYYRSGGETAEVGLVITDGVQGRGLGTAMLERLASLANLDGISIFDTIISPENTRMIKMVKDMGFPTSVSTVLGMIRIRFPTSIDPATIGQFESTQTKTPTVAPAHEAPSTP